jgi:hypothetical protein
MVSFIVIPSLNLNGHIRPFMQTQMGRTEYLHPVFFSAGRKTGGFSGMLGVGTEFAVIQ